MNGMTSENNTQNIPNYGEIIFWSVNLFSPPQSEYFWSFQGVDDTIF